MHANSQDLYNYSYILECIIMHVYLTHFYKNYCKLCLLLHPEAARATNTQQTWRQEFLGSRSSSVERSSTRTAAAGTFLRFFQTIFENTPLWRLKCLVTLSTYRRYINECIYLSIYLSIYFLFIT